MIPESPPPRQERALTAGWGTATLRGGLAFLAMAALGQVAAFAAFAADGGRGSETTYAKLGWFYFGMFHHVGVEFRLPDLAFGQPGSFDVSGIVPSGGSLTLRIGAAFLLATAAGAWLLYRAGRATATRAGGAPLARALHGMKVAPAYAIPSVVVSLLVSIRVEIPQNQVVNGALEVKAAAAQAFIYPLLLAVVAGAAGGLRSARDEPSAREPRARRVAGVLAGGVRMFALGLVLSFVGLLALAVAEPDATKAYFEGVSSSGRADAAVLIGNHVLLLPNQSMWVLVPAMGGCDGAYGAGRSYPVLCYWKYPRSISVSPLGAATGQPGAARFGFVPPGYWLFLLVPALSVLLGGRAAASRAGASSRSEASVLGAAAGVVFAVLVVAGAGLSSVSFGVSTTLQGLPGGGSGRVGPDIVAGGLLALAWGVVGGWIGGLLHARDLPKAPPAPIAEAQPEREPEPGPEPPGELPPPPPEGESRTS